MLRWTTCHPSLLQLFSHLLLCWHLSMTSIGQFVNLGITHTGKSTRMPLLPILPDPDLGSKVSEGNFRGSCQIPCFSKVLEW